MELRFFFVNQILFYSLLSKESQSSNNPIYPPIRTEDRDSPEKLQEYFELVRQRDYEPIYGVNISHLFKGSSSRLACKSVVTAIFALAPKSDSTDLAGQVFQTLIPSEIRKPLGANYTNPNAAKLLATMAISNPNANVLDPSCGSGTLLVSAYRRKMELSTGNPTELHQKFVEEQITGIDVMAFSGHLAAVNLALQQPLFETDHVRIGLKDSTSLQPGSFVPSTEGALPSELKQITLESVHSVKRVKKFRNKVIKMGKNEAKGFDLTSVDLVIMNPPFTSWDNMDENYRDSLRARFSFRPVYRDMIYFKPSQQLFFLFLADIFLKPGGHIAAVLPLTTLTASSFHELVRYLNSNYIVEAIVMGLGRAAFSEDTSLTECLFIAKKQTPEINHKFLLIGTKQSPLLWTPDIIAKLSKQAKSQTIGEDQYSIRKRFNQSELLPEKKGLSGLYLSLLGDYSRAASSLEDLIKFSPLPLLEVWRFNKTNGNRSNRMRF